jgi:hypothetical protein
MLGTINGLQPQKRANTFFLICWPGVPNSRKNSKLFLGISPFEKSFAFSLHNFPDARVKTRIFENNRRLARYLTTRRVFEIRNSAAGGAPGADRTSQFTGKLRHFSAFFRSKK